MPYGQLYFGKTGFFHKKCFSGGSRYNPPYGLITGQDKHIYNKYISGTGVGAVSTSVRRAKLFRATSCNDRQKCGAFYKGLGIDQSKP